METSTATPPVHPPAREPRDRRVLARSPSDLDSLWRRSACGRREARRAADACPRCESPVETIRGTAACICGIDGRAGAFEDGDERAGGVLQRGCRGGRGFQGWWGGGGVGGFEQGESGCGEVDTVGEGRGGGVDASREERAGGCEEGGSEGKDVTDGVRVHRTDSDVSLGDGAKFCCGFHSGHELLCLQAREKRHTLI